MKPKLRITVEPIFLQGEGTRFGLKDHTGRWVNRTIREETLDYPYLGSEVEFWRARTSETPEQALEEHMPPDYDILPPDTRVTRIEIETLSNDKQLHRFYVERDAMPTFLIAPKDVKFYSFETLGGTTEIFLYSDIRHISFKEV